VAQELSRIRYPGQCRIRHEDTDIDSVLYLPGKFHWDNCCKYLKTRETPAPQIADYRSRPKAHKRTQDSCAELSHSIERRVQVSYLLFSRSEKYDVEFPRVALQGCLRWRLAAPQLTCGAATFAILGCSRAAPPSSRISFSPKSRSAHIPRLRHVSIKRLESTMGRDCSVYLRLIT